MINKNRPALNDGELNDAERSIIFLIRNLDLFDSVEIKYAKRGELIWKLTKSSRGVYNLLDE